MDIDAEGLDRVIERTKEEIARLTRGLASLEKARASLEEARQVLRVLSDHLPLSNGVKKREHEEHRAPQFEPRIIRNEPPEGHDLAGKTLLEVADILFEENENRPLSPDEIVTDALSRGYRSTHPKNKENDPTKLARSVRLMMERRPDKYEHADGRFHPK
jgi:hypothetical protein